MTDGSGKGGLDGIFRPRNVAVVGATDQEHSIGQKLMSNLLNYGFKGPVFPVNPGRRVVHSIKAYARVSDIPERVDLAILAVSREHVLGVVEDCAASGVRGIVTITAGFKETGEEGAELERKIARICAESKIRMVGPDCMGVINTDREVMLLGSFAATLPVPGNAAFMSQSGALGEAILAHARRIGVGISMFASLGNKADVSADDLLEYWEADPKTELILIYLESFGDPRAFTTLARRISRKKPILAVKAGRTAHGARAAASHTGALAGADIAIDAMMAQCGVLRAGSIEELFHMASVLATQKLPEGRRLGIVTNAGGPGILATDAAETLGLNVAGLDEATRATLRAALPAECSVTNPVDLIADADASRYGKVFEILKDISSVDMYLIIFVSPIMIDAVAVAREIASFKEACGKPLVACVMGRLGENDAQAVLQHAGVPTFTFPESAIAGLQALANQAEWVNRPAWTPAYLDGVDKALARAALEPTLASGGEAVPPEAAASILEAYGIPLAPIVTVKDSAGAYIAAEKVGWPVAVKVAPSSPALSHKSDLGGVRLGIGRPEDLSNACHELEKISRDNGGDGSLLIQPMLPSSGAHELILGIKTDPQFGPLVMVGAGGIYVEYTRDVSFRVAPIDERDAREMLESLRTYPILEGVRGEQPAAIDVAVSVLLRLSRLAEDLPEIVELDINPFVLGSNPEECAGVDVRMTVRA